MATLPTSFKIQEPNEVFFTDLEPDDCAALEYIARTSFLPAFTIVVSESPEPVRKLGILSALVTAFKKAKYMDKSARITTYVGAAGGSNYPYDSMPRDDKNVVRNLDLQSGLMRILSTSEPKRLWLFAPIRDFVEPKFIPENYEIVMYGSFNLRVFAENPEHREFMLQLVENSKYTFLYESYFVTGEKNAFNLKNAKDLFSFYRKNVPVILEAAIAWNKHILLDCFDEIKEQVPQLEGFEEISKENDFLAKEMFNTEESLKRNMKIIIGILRVLPAFAKLQITGENDFKKVEALSREEFIEIVNQHSDLDKSLLSCDVAAVATYMATDLWDPRTKQFNLSPADLSFHPAAFRTQYNQNAEGKVQQIFIGQGLDSGTTPISLERIAELILEREVCI